MVPRRRRGRAGEGAAVVLVAAAALAAAPAHAGPDHAHGLAADVPAGEAPARWTAGVGLGDDRSGDLRPEAAAILDAIAARRGAYTVGDARAAGLVAPLGAAIARVPATIRVWRRGLDGSTSSCSGRVDVIPFDRYVKGVLPHEWIRSWDLESLRAGAVAIRTYAAAWVAAGGKYTCADLDDTTASQVYRDDFYERTDGVVDETAGQVVVRGDDLVFAEYSAENGDPTRFDVAEPLCTGRAVNGHGRGTCQWGTQRWALDGRSYDWMMRHYYPGADVAGIEPVWDAALAGEERRLEMVSGEEAVVWLEYVNAGTTTWEPATVLVGTAGDQASPFYKEENWVSPSRPTGVDRSGPPGEVARFTWAAVAPEVATTTVFTERYALVTADGVWFAADDGAVTWTITVHPRDGAGGGDGDVSGGCAAGGGRAPGCAILAIGALALVLRRRRGRR